MTADPNKTSALLAELEEHNRALAAAAAEPALHAKLKQANAHREQTAGVLNRRTIERTQVTGWLAGDKAMGARAKERLAQLRCAIPRLQAGLSEGWGVLDSYDTAVRGLDFFVHNFAKKLSVRTADLKAAEKREDEASAVHKLALADVAAVEKEIAASKASSDAKNESVFD